MGTPTQNGVVTVTARPRSYSHFRKLPDLTLKVKHVDDLFKKTQYVLRVLKREVRASRSAGDSEDGHEILYSES